MADRYAASRKLTIDRLVFYARNPRENDAAVDRMCSNIREFGFKVPVLARSDGEVVDGHLRRKAAASHFGRRLDSGDQVHRWNRMLRQPPDKHSIGR